MTLFETLLLAHIAGDWLLQNEWQAVNKSQNPWALLSHIGLYHSIILAVLLPKFGIMNIRVYIVVGLAGLLACVYGSWLARDTVHENFPADRRSPTRAIFGFSCRPIHTHYAAGNFGHFIIPVTGFLVYLSFGCLMPHHV